jgi:HD-GYP domain-containing protein (c-di-GMP phosphodiesterase class II)
LTPERADRKVVESIVNLRDRAEDAWLEFIGERGWRSIAGPAAFAVVAIGLLLYDHLQERVPAGIFWLALLLIITVVAWMLQASRKQHGVLEEHTRKALTDHTTGLGNRLQLGDDVNLATAQGEQRVLLLFDIDGLQAYSDRYGYAASDDLLRRTARALSAAATPLGGSAFRVDDSRFAMLIPPGGRSVGEIVLAATATIQTEGKDLPIGRSYGEISIPEEATDPEVAMQIAGQRLTSHSQSQNRSARRQAHAVLVAVLAARRPELRGHLRVVAFRAIALGRRLGLTREEIDDVSLAAELQDVGLLSVPESTLEKEASLTEEEAALIRGRPVAGEKIIAAAPGLAPVAALVRSSAEHFDGSGFPDGLAGESIPIGARIVAVAVAFAAMTAHRPYRVASTAEEALAELRRCAGSQFDPQVVEALAVDLSEELAPTPAPAAPPHSPGTQPGVAPAGAAAEAPRTSVPPPSPSVA